MTASPFSVRRFFVIFSVAWLILAGEHAALLYWYNFAPQVAIIDSIISNTLLLGVCLLIINTIRFFSPGKAQYSNIIIMCLVLTILWLLLTRWFLALALGDEGEYTSFLRHSLIIRFSVAFLVAGIVTTVSIIWYNWQDQQYNESREMEIEKTNREAELFKLRQQLQPHFLFNSLNSINALIGSRPEEARKMVQQLSDFLRGTLKKEETQWISLGEELQYLQLYLDIEKVRFGNRLETAIESDEAVSQLKLPALLLQPIVENAIKFGLYDTTGQTIIRMQATKEGNALVIKVSNPFDPETSSPKQGTGFGLKSVQRRLYLLFARTDLLLIDSKENTFITMVTIPQVPDTAAKP